MDEDRENAVSWSDYEREIQAICAVKAEEFHMLGYEEVTAEDVWDCVRQSFKGPRRLHEVVSAVLTLNAGRFMNWMTMNAYKGVLGEDVFSPRRG